MLVSLCMFDSLRPTEPVGRVTFSEVERKTGVVFSSWHPGDVTRVAGYAFRFLILHPDGTVTFPPGECATQEEAEKALSRLVDGRR